MNKKKQIILFVIVVSLGIFLIDSVLLSLEDEECNCYDSAALSFECESACMAFGGCSEPWLHQPGECLGFFICSTQVSNWCRTPDTKRVIGWHYDFMCGACYTII